MTTTKTAKLYTAEDLKEFDKLTWKLSSLRQMDRIEARLGIAAYIEKHGKEKCDQMFEVLMGRDAKRGQT